MTFRTLLREPLVHFLALGLALFLVHGLVAPGPRDDDSIVIPAPTVAALRAQYQKLWGRPPTAAELKALVEARINDEILYREGMAMGLDGDDELIKRRVRQKYELMAEEDDGGDTATDAQLQAWLVAHPDAFRTPPIVTFQQIMVPFTGNEAQIAARIAAIRAALKAGAVPGSLSENTLLPGAMTAVPLDLVARDFGGRFASAVGDAALGLWDGPFASSYGVHLVRVDARTPAAVPALDSVRAQVAREWENDRRTKARAARLAALRRQYDVVIEGLPAGAAK